MILRMQTFHGKSQTLRRQVCVSQGRFYVFVYDKLSICAERDADHHELRRKSAAKIAPTEASGAGIVEPLIHASGRSLTK